MSAPLRFTTALHGLDLPLAVPVAPSPLPDLVLLHRRPALATQLGLPAGWLDTEDFRLALAGAAPLPGAESVASVYAGHQFGHFVPQLGDGRAHLIGTWQAPGGHPWELQLKGSGQTPFSRFADGRAVLRSSLREYVASEAMAALGLPTTRALALGLSHEPVRRERMERAAVVLRVAPSFLRFGHFEYWAARRQPEAVRTLADAAISTHFPAHIGNHEGWLREVLERTATLMAGWQTLGFCHGVMNTDNMSLLGLTLDYGPYGFLDGFDPGHICNHSDDSGRYAWDQQPRVGQWNCARLLEACLDLLDADPERAVERAQRLLEAYSQRYAAEADARWRAKFGLSTAEPDDEALMQDFLQLLAREQVDFTLAFRHLPDTPRLRDFFIDQEALATWLQRYRQRLTRDPRDADSRRRAQHAVNPLYLPRNHLLQEAIVAAENDDPAPLDRLMQVLEQPYTEQPGAESYAALPPAWARELQISCSS